MISKALLRVQFSISKSVIRRLSSAASDFRPAAHNNSVDEPEGSKSALCLNAGNYARPSNVIWSKRLHNSVSFIGTVAYPLKKFATGSDKFGVHSSLRVKTSIDSHTSFWITFQMWDELAERAFLHLKPNDCIYISGELGSYTKSNSEGVDILRYKVIAKELNYAKLDEPAKDIQRVVDSGVGTGESSIEKYRNRLQLWQMFFANPSEWYDDREKKKNPKQPDFRHKSTGEVLWLNASNPPWVKKQVELLDSRLSGRPKNDAPSTFSPSRWLPDY